MSAVAKDGVVRIHGRPYKTVALRVAEFRQAFPVSDGWAIVTEPHFDGDLIRVKAQIVSPDGTVVALDWAEEKRGSTLINKTSALENCSTSAIGRALAAAGFGGSEYASADELVQALVQQGDEKPDAVDEFLAATEPPPLAPGPPDPKTSRFMTAMFEVGEALEKVLTDEGNQTPKTEVKERLQRMLGSEGFEKLEDIKDSDSRRRVHKRWQGMLEEAKKLAAHQAV